MALYGKGGPFCGVPLLAAIDQTRSFTSEHENVCSLQKLPVARPEASISCAPKLYGIRQANRHCRSVMFVVLKPALPKRMQGHGLSEELPTEPETGRARLSAIVIFRATDHLG